jgi:ParB family chromosome partitioning protein
MLELALIENIQREDLNAMDRARAYRRYCHTFGLRVEDVAERVGEDRSTVANYVRLLDLPDEVQKMVAKGDIAMGHARCLLAIADSSRRIQLANAVVGNQLSVRALEELVRRERTRGSGEADIQRTAVRTVSPHLADIQRRFEETVRTKVVIKEGKRKGTGRIVLEYHSLDEFDRLASMLGVQLD